jgi:hypothetical protein
MYIEPLPVVGGWLEMAGQAATIAAMGLLVLMFVAMGGYAYKQLRGGVEWPEESADEGDGLSSGGEDDEWDYY